MTDLGTMVPVSRATRGLIARYRSWLPLADDDPVVSLGEGVADDRGRVAEVLHEQPVDADRGGGHLLLGQQRRDLRQRADEGRLAHSEPAGDEHL